MKKTDKEQAWLESYLQHFNATRAARDAGYKWPNKVGYRKKEKFAIEIKQRLDDDAMSAAEVLSRLARQARFDLGQFVTIDDEGKAKFDLVDLKKSGLGNLIKSIANTAHGVKVDFYDAQAALVHLGKTHALFTDKIKLASWRDEVVDLLRTQRISILQVVDEFGTDTARELATLAGFTKTDIEKSAPDWRTETKAMGLDPDTFVDLYSRLLADKMIAEGETPQDAPGRKTDESGDSSADA